MSSILLQANIGICFLIIVCQFIQRITFTVYSIGSNYNSNNWYIYLYLYLFDQFPRTQYVNIHECNQIEI